MVLTNSIGTSQLLSIAAFKGMKMARNFVVLTALLLIAVQSCHGRYRSVAGFTESRVTGGRPVAGIEYIPYMASIHDSGIFICGSVIISRYHILTTGDCIESTRTDDITVVVGTIRPYANRTGWEFPVKDAIYHPKYQFDSRDYNVAILRLRRILPYNERVMPIPIATEGARTGMTIMVAGWGETKEGEGIQERLQFAYLHVYSQQICTDMYENAIEFSDRMFCTVEDGKGTCHGDNGGPAVYNGKLIGIVLMRPGCGVPHVPDIFVNIVNPLIREFIMTVMDI